MADRVEGPALHEAELGNARRDRFEHLGRLRALEREKRLLAHVVDDGRPRQERFEDFEVALLGGAVDDDIELVAAPGGHQIVDDRAVLGQQHRIAQAHVAKQLQLARKQRLQRLVDMTAVKQDLAHVADVEQASILADPQMLGHDAFVLDGHVIAGERDHSRRPGAGATRRAEACPARLRQSVTALGIAAIRLAARLGLVGRAVVDFSAHHRAPVATAARDRPAPTPSPPSVARPESFHQP